MAKVLILGAGLAGHTAALHAERMLGKENEIIVVSPTSKYNWIPSNIWVVVGKMKADKVTFPLAPVYKKKGMTFHQALAQEIHPEGDVTTDNGFLQFIRFAAINLKMIKMIRKGHNPMEKKGK